MRLYETGLGRHEFGIDRRYRVEEIDVRNLMEPGKQILSCAPIKAMIIPIGAVNYPIAVFLEYIRTKTIQRTKKLDI